MMALYNSWAFLWKQKKYETVPLLMFYIVLILLATIRVYYSIFFFYGYKSYDYIGYLMKPILTINLGVTQCWILFELAVRIDQNIKLTAKLDSMKKKW